MYIHYITLFYYIHICILYACTYMYSAVRGRFGRARAARVRPCARACVCDWAATHPRRTVRAPSRRRGPRVARRAGVLVGDGVQREHRRVEHRLSVDHCLGMRRLFGPGRRATAGGRVLGTAARRNAGMYVQTHMYVHPYILYMYMYIVCMDAWMHVCMFIFMYMYMYECV